MRELIVPLAVLAGVGVVAWVATRPAGAPPSEPSGTQEPEVGIPGVGGVQIPGVPWYVRSPEDIAAIVGLEAQRVAMGGRLNVRPAATCAGGTCG